VDEEQGAVLVGVVTEDDAEPAPPSIASPSASYGRPGAFPEESSPSSSSRSNAYSMPSVTVPEAAAKGAGEMRRATPEDGPLDAS
jgi:hypothetical protein